MLCKSLGLMDLVSSPRRQHILRFSQYAPHIRRIHEPHDLPHILPSAYSPEEVDGSLLNSTYLNVPANYRMLGRRKTRSARILLL